MPKTIIGVDVGTQSVKAVELRSGYKGVEVVNCMEIPHGEGALRKLFGKTIGDQVSGAVRTIIVTALPQASMRVVSLPFRDEKKIEQVIQYEIETFIPFPLDEVVVSWYILGGFTQQLHTDYETGTSPVEGSEVLVAAVPKTTVKEFLAGFSREGIDPMIVDLDALIPAAFFPLTHSGDSPTALCDIGAGKSSITIFSQGRLTFARVIPYGGKDITESLKKKAGLSWEKAEEEKIQTGASEGGHGKIVAESLEQFSCQISQTFLSAEEMTKIKVGKILLYGGGAKLHGLREFLAKKFTMDVDYLHIDHPIPGAYDPLVFAKAMGLALREATRSRDASTMNFRKGEFSFRMPREEIRGKIRVAGTLLGIGLLLGLISFIVSFSLKEAKLKNIIRETRQIFMSSYPHLPVPDDILAEMQTQVTRERMRVTGEGRQRSILDIVREVSSRIPKDIKVDVQEMNIDSGKIRILGITESLDAVDRIVNELKKYDLFSDISVLDTRRSSDGNSFNFQLSVSFRGS